MKIKKILIIGYGNIAQRHASILKKIISHSSIKYFRRTKSVKLTKRKNFLFKEIEVQNFQPDMIIIANASSFHIRTCNKFLKYEVPFFIEKPISDNYENALNFIKICQRKKIHIFIGYNLLFTKSLQIIKNTINRKNFGIINYVNVETGYNLKSWRKNIDYKNSVSSKKNLGGGVLLELSHELNYLIWLFGNVKLFNAYYSKLSNLSINVEDYANIRVIFSKNKFSKKLFANLNLDFIRNDKKRLISIIGDKNTIIWDGVLGIVKIFNDKTLKWNILFDDINDVNKSYINQWKFFLKSLKSEPDSKLTIQALKTLQLINKIKNKKNSVL